MGLQLNEQVVPYREFYGRNTEQMPLLIADGRLPLSVSGFMHRRLEVRGAKYSSKVRSAWHDNYFDTGDALLNHPDGKIKIVPDALRDISPESKLSNGALVMPTGLYEYLDGQEFTKEDLRKYVKDYFTRVEAKQNPLWQALARDKNLLNDYADFVFDETKTRFGYDQNMGLYIPSFQKEPTARLWYVDWREYWSSAYGGVVGTLTTAALSGYRRRRTARPKKQYFPNH